LQERQKEVDAANVAKQAKQAAIHAERAQQVEKRRREAEAQQAKEEAEELQRRIDSFQLLKDICGACSGSCAECSVTCLGCHRNYHPECTEASYLPWIREAAEDFRCDKCTRALGGAAYTAEASGPQSGSLSAVGASTRGSAGAGSSTKPSQAVATHVGSGPEAIELLLQVAKIQRIRVIQRNQLIQPAYEHVRSQLEPVWTENSVYMKVLWNLHACIFRRLSSSSP
jgi:hypothetical protein